MINQGKIWDGDDDFEDIPRSEKNFEGENNISLAEILHENDGDDLSFE